MSDIAEQTGQTTAPPAEAQKPDTTAEVMIPKSRFDEVNSRLKELQTAQERLEAERAEREKAELEQRSEYETLYKQATAEQEKTTAELTAIREQAQAAQAVLESLWEAKKGIVPEVYQPLVEKLTLTERLQWLSDNESKLTTKAVTSTTPLHKTGNGNGASATPDFSKFGRVKL